MKEEYNVVREEHDIALWAGIVAFLSTLLTVGVFDILDPERWVEYFGGFLVAFITGGAVYAKQRYDDAKRRKEDTVNPPTTYKKKG